jgi:hypothetical protein
MQHEQPDYDGDNLAEIWQSAQHRRTEDIYSWLTQFFERRQQLKSNGDRAQHAQGHTAALGKC